MKGRRWSGGPLRRGYTPQVTAAFGVLYTMSFQGGKALSTHFDILTGGNLQTKVIWCTLIFEPNPGF